MAVSSFARFKGGFPTPQQEDGVALVDGLEELLREPAEALHEGWHRGALSSTHQSGKTLCMRFVAQ